MRGDGFGFAQATAIVPYLAALGVSHLYASPLQQARKGSTHGYDTVDPTRLDPALGTAEEFDARITLRLPPSLKEAVEQAAGTQGASVNAWVVDAIDKGTERAVHFCFGNYGGQVIQHGHWAAILDFLNALHTDHLIMELAHRPPEDLEALRGVDPRIKIGIGVVDVKVNRVETPEDIARRIEAAEKAIGPGRVRWIHPDCGFWMLKRTVADRKIAALPKGRDLYLGKARGAVV